MTTRMERSTWNPNLNIGSRDDEAANQICVKAYGKHYKLIQKHAMEAYSASRVCAAAENMC